MDGWSKADRGIGGDGSVPSAVVKESERESDREEEAAVHGVCHWKCATVLSVCYLHTLSVCVCVPDCGLSYISQILSELGTASSLKTVSGFLGCGQRSCVCVWYILFII